MSQNFGFALCNRRIGQTFVSPPAEPGVYLNELSITHQLHQLGYYIQTNSFPLTGGRLGWGYNRQIFCNRE